MKDKTLSPVKQKKPHGQNLKKTVSADIESSKKYDPADMECTV